MKLNSLIPELYCSDYTVSLKFYVDILGFHILYDRPEEGFAMLAYHGTQIMLDEIVPGKRTWLTGNLEKPFVRGINLQIDTDEVDALYNRIQNSGTKIFLDTEEKWYRADRHELGARQFLVQDPDGYLLRFAQDLGQRPLNSDF